MHGLNVTIPHKRTITAHLDRLTPLAEEIGAVNTVYLEDNHAVGDNTDALGFLLDLERLTGLPAHRVGNPPSPGYAIVLGGGGAARAVSFALMSAGWQVDLAARRIEEIQPWVEGLQKKLVFPDRSAGRIFAVHLDPESIQSLTADNSRYPFVLVVNASSAGMLPNVDTTPWPDGLPLPAGAFMYDLVYKPLETRLVREARAAGCPAANGLGMLVEQAARAFELWTGQEAPRPAMRQAVGLDAEGSAVSRSRQFDLRERQS